MFFVQINHTGKGFLFLIFREIKLRKYSSLHKLFYGLNIFDTYTKKNQIHLRLLKEVPLYNQKKHKVDDANYWKMINSITKNVHADIYKLTLFKAHSSYYAYVQINQWILDAGTLYEYNPKSNILRKLCDFDGKEVMADCKIKLNTSFKF